MLHLAGGRGDDSYRGEWQQGTGEREGRSHPDRICVRSRFSDLVILCACCHPIYSGLQPSQDRVYYQTICHTFLFFILSDASLLPQSCVVKTSMGPRPHIYRGTESMDCTDLCSFYVITFSSILLPTAWCIPGVVLGKNESQFSPLPYTLYRSSSSSSSIASLQPPRRLREGAIIHLPARAGTRPRYTIDGAPWSTSLPSMTMAWSCRSVPAGSTSRLGTTLSICTMCCAWFFSIQQEFAQRAGAVV